MATAGSAAGLAVVGLVTAEGSEVKDLVAVDWAAVGSEVEANIHREAQVEVAAAGWEMEDWVAVDWAAADWAAAGLVAVAGSAAVN